MLPTRILPSLPSLLLQVCVFAFVFFVSCSVDVQRITRNPQFHSQFKRLSAIDGSEAPAGNRKKGERKPETDPLDLKNGTRIPSLYDLHLNKNLRLLFYFNYGLNSFNTRKLVLNPRFYSKYVIIQSK